METSACKICFHQLEGPEGPNKRPRFLGCGHAFCTSCLNQIIFNDKVKCPMCFQIQNDVKSVGDLPIAFALEEMMGAISKSKPDVPPKPKYCATTSGLYTNLADFHCYRNEDDDSQCKEHKFNCIFHCETHNVFICHICTVVDHPNSKCSVIAKQEAIDQKKALYSNTLEKLTKSTSQLIEKYKLYSTEIEKCKVKHNEMSKKLNEQAQKHSNQAKKLEQSYKCITDAIEEFESAQTQIATIQIDVSCAKTVNDVAEVKNKVNPLVHAHNNLWKEKWIWHEKYTEVNTAREEVAAELKDFIMKEKEELKKLTNGACSFDVGAQKPSCVPKKSSEKSVFDILEPNLSKLKFFKNSKK